MKLDLADPDASAPLFAGDFVWHFFNPKLPDVAAVETDAVVV